MERTSLALLSPRLLRSFGSPKCVSARPRSRRARPLVKGGKACVIRSAFPRSNRRSDATSRCLSEGPATRRCCAPGLAFRSSIHTPRRDFARLRASPRSLACSFEIACLFGQDVVDRLLQLRHARGHNPIESSDLAPIDSLRLIERSPCSECSRAREDPRRAFAQRPVTLSHDRPRVPTRASEGMRVHNASRLAFGEVEVRVS